MAAERDAAVRVMIPQIYKVLLGSNVPIDEPVVIFHDVAQQPDYGLCTLRGLKWPPVGSGISRGGLVEPLRRLDRRYRERGLSPANIFVAVDVLTEHAPLIMCPVRGRAHHPGRSVRRQDAVNAMRHLPFLERTSRKTRSR